MCVYEPAEPLSSPPPSFDEFLSAAPTSAAAASPHEDTGTPHETHARTTHTHTSTHTLSVAHKASWEQIKNTDLSVSYWLEGDASIHLLLQLHLSAVCQTFLTNPESVIGHGLQSSALLQEVTHLRR